MNTHTHTHPLQDIFAQVEFKQLNLANSTSAEKAFADGPFDIVYNLAAETKYGQSEQVPRGDIPPCHVTVTLCHVTQVYEERILTVAVNCAQAAAGAGVKKFIHVSTGQVYDSSKGVSREESKVDPWTQLAKYHLKAEGALRDVPGSVVSLE